MPDPSAIETADCLVAAATRGTLAECPVADSLARLRRLQDTGASGLHGTFRSREGDRTVADPAIGSVVGLRLAILRIAFAEPLGAEATAHLDEMLGDLESWTFRSCKRRRHYSPSRALADLACGWLVAEAQARGDTSRLESAMTALAEYCEETGWGNGEHLGESTSAQCLDALSVLLVLAKRLPDDLRSRCRALLDGLLEIDDAFGPLLRVPLLGRSPSDAPRTASYRARILDPDHDAALPGFLRRHGWKEIAGSPAPPTERFETMCFGGTTASAQIEPDVRLGSLERFPLMPSAEHLDAGLSWQAYPVVFAKPEGDCGFFQWETREGDAVALHPGDAPRALTAAVNPPIVGRTFAIQKGADVIVLRVLPAVAQAWERVIDRFRVTDPHAEWSAERIQTRWRLRLRYSRRTIAVSRFDLPGTPAPTLSGDAANGLRWDLRYDRSALEGRRTIAHLWAISLEKGSAWLPAIVPCIDHDVPRAPDEAAYDFRWKSATQNWHLLIDPLSPTPLAEL